MADVCLQTSMGEGFGIPTIEAQASTAALKGSTEGEQFFDAKHG